MTQQRLADDDELDAASDQPMQFTAGTGTVLPGDRIPFQLAACSNPDCSGCPDEQVLMAVRPKMSALLGVAGSVATLTTEGASVGAQMGAAGAVMDFAQICFDGYTRVHLQERFDDPEDHLDVLHLIEEPVDDDGKPTGEPSIVQYFIGRWFGRPTGPRVASAGSRRGTGKRSTVRRRSAG